MQPMSDAVAVLGSRHGLFIEPTAGKAYLIRSSRFPGVPVRVIAGVRMGKRTVTLPLSDHGEALEFVDHDSTPCTIKLTGIDPDTGIKVELSLATPFLPRDADFSTTPVIGLKLVCSRLREKFRWSPHNNPQQPIELFLALESQSFDSPVV
ncbi:MAG TPA: hypothetical protein VGJ84_05075, partial [Polyangiaceae bacterium]